MLLEQVTRNALHTALLGTIVNSPKLTTPFPFVSNSWNAVLYRASGTHSSPSNAWNSGNEMSLQKQKTMTKLHYTNILIFKNLWQNHFSHNAFTLHLYLMTQS